MIQFNLCVFHLNIRQPKSRGGGEDNFKLNSADVTFSKIRIRNLNTFFKRSARKKKKERKNINLQQVTLGLH